MKPAPLQSDTETELREEADKRRRWTRVMPAVFVTYSLAYLDRANYGFGAAAGLAHTLQITASRSALLGALFFLGYFLFQVPGAAYARKQSARRLIFWSLIGWGGLAALTGVIRNFWLLAADRFLLGVAESFVMPALLVLLTDWFTRSERSRANTFLILGNPVTVLWMSAITGYLIRAVGWQTAFVLEGIPSIIWAFAWLYLVHDRPDQAPWMSREAQRSITAQLDEEQNALPPVASTREALLNSRVILLSGQFFLWSAGVYGFVLWLPTIIQTGAAQGIEITGLLSAVPYALAIAAMLLTSRLSDRTGERKHFVWPFLLLAGVAFLVSYRVAAQSFWWAYLFLVLAAGGMYAPYGPFYATVPEMLPRNVSGQAMAFINSCGGLGGFFGAWLVGELASRTHGSSASFLAMAGALILSGVIILFLRVPARAESPLRSAHGG
jgi:sugar phosphate permease